MIFKRLFRAKDGRLLYAVLLCRGSVQLWRWVPGLMEDLVLELFFENDEQRDTALRQTYSRAKTYANGSKTNSATGSAATSISEPVVGGSSKR